MLTGNVRMQAPWELHLGDTVRLRKPHPCGSYEWEIVRVGADIGIRCRQCGRRVLLTRRAFRRRVKTLIPRGEPIAVISDQ